jgi:hypothetical protein
MAACQFIVWNIELQQTALGIDRDRVSLVD